jgi:hypothetical protein
VLPVERGTTPEQVDEVAAALRELPGPVQYDAS